MDWPVSCAKRWCGSGFELGGRVSEKAASFGIDDRSASPPSSRILADLVRQGGLTRKELAAAAYVGETTSSGGYLRRLRQQGLIHISGWRRSASGSFPPLQFSLGSGRRIHANPSNRAVAVMEHMFEAILRDGPLNYRQAAAAAGLSPNKVKNADYLVT